MEIKMRLKNVLWILKQKGIELYVTRYKNGNEKYHKKENVYKLINSYIKEGRFTKLQKIVHLTTPMLCKRFETEEEVEEVYNSEEYVVEEKLNGNRCWIVYDSERGEFEFYSRHRIEDLMSDEIFKRNPITVFRNWFKEIGFKYNKSFILDSEITMPEVGREDMEFNGIPAMELEAVSMLINMNEEESEEIQRRLGYPLRFNVFDIMYIERPIFNKTYEERQEELTKIFKDLKELPFRKVESYGGGDKKFYIEMKKESDIEGFVFKNRKSRYDVSGRRTRDWYKLKRGLFGFEKDTMVGYIVDFNYGTEGTRNSKDIGSIEIGVRVRQKDGTEYEKVIARVSGISDKIKEVIKEEGEDGKIRIKEEYKQIPVEIGGFAFSKKTNVIRHATFQRFRPDLTIEDCVLDEEEIMENAK